MNYRILILLPTFFLINAPDIRAHNLITAKGTTQNHQHVYRRQEYGKPLQQGHLVQHSGGSSMIFWGSSARSYYGKSTVRRSGPIIQDQYPNLTATPKVSNKFGSTVKNYGKAVHGYGKPDRGK